MCPGVRAYPGDDCTVLCVLLLLGWVLSEVGGGGGGRGHWHTNGTDACSLRTHGSFPAFSVWLDVVLLHCDLAVLSFSHCARHVWTWVGGP